MPNDVVVSVGPWTAVFEPDTDWVIRSLSYGRHRIIPRVASTNGAVLQFESSSWAGGFHGNQVVTGVEAHVNGVLTGLAAGDRVVADALTLQITMNYGGAVDIVRTVMLTPSILQQTTKFTTTDPSENVTVAYMHLNSIANAFSDVVMKRSDGTTFEATTNANDGSETAEVDNVISTRMTDPVSGLTVVSRWGAPARVHVWDRSFDNKLYYNVTELRGTGSKSWITSQSIEVIEE